MKLNELQRFLKNFIFRLIALSISVIVGIFLIKHLSSVLHVDGWGKLNFIEKYCNYFLVLAIFGMDVVAVRLIAGDRSNLLHIFSTLVPLKLIISSILFLLMLVPIVFIEKMHNISTIIIIYSLAIFSIPFSGQSIFEATKRMEIPSIIEAMLTIINFILIYIFVKDPESLIYVAFITVIIYLLRFAAHNAIIIKIHGPWLPKIDISVWKTLLKSGVVIGFIQVSVIMIHYFDIFLLGLMKGDRSVGLYSAAYQAMFMIIYLMAIIQNLMNPILFENYKQDIQLFSTNFKKYFKFIIFVGYGMTFIFILLAPDYLGIFYNIKDYHESVYCFKILMISIFLMTLNFPLHSGLLAAHKEKLLLKIIGFQLVVNVLINILLIPKYGIIGSSIATIVAEFVVLPLYIYHLNKVISVSFIRNMLIALASSLPMALFLYFSSIHFIPRAFIGIMIMILFTVLLRGYTYDELQLLIRMVISIEKTGKRVNNIIHENNKTENDI